MSKIISISLSDDVLALLGKLQADLGFSGRSETIRAALRLLAAEQKSRKRLKGVCDAVLLVIHKEDRSEEVSEIRHKYSSIIKTHIHNHLESHKCLEIFVLKGEAPKVAKMTEDLQASRSVELAKLIVS